MTRPQIGWMAAQNRMISIGLPSHALDLVHLSLVVHVSKGAVVHRAEVVEEIPQGIQGLQVVARFHMSLSYAREAMTAGNDIETRPEENSPLKHVLLYYWAVTCRQQRGHGKRKLGRWPGRSISCPQERSRRNPPSFCFPGGSRVSVRRGIRAVFWVTRPCAASHLTVVCTWIAPSATP